VLALALLFACYTAPPSAPAPIGRTVLLVTLDTTRADVLGAYGASPSPSPAFDALAARGLLAMEAQTVTPLTLPAHSSILTGLTPDHHGVRDNSGFRLDEAQTTLAERFAAGGWRTGAFVSAIVLEELFGTAQGFEVYRDDFDLTGQPDAIMTVASWPSREVVDKASAWLHTLGPQDDAFLWVHLYDAHRPFHIDPPQRDPFDGAYVSAVATADAQVQRLLDELNGLGRAGQLTVAVLGDHGESNGDHGEQAHGQLLYRSTTRVPLALAGPGIAPGTVLADPVSVVDLAPTLLALAGLPADGALDGANLLAAPDLRPRYAETWYPRHQFGFAELRALQTPRWRYILAPREELYDWRADPSELHNVASEHPDVVATLKEALTKRVIAPSARGATDAEVASALAALGYLSGPTAVPEGARFDALPDPKDAPNLQAELEQIIDDARRRPPLEGAALLEGFLARWPKAMGARTLVALAYERGGEPAHALELLGPLLDESPADVQLLARVAQLEVDLGQIDAAKGHIERALALAPDYAPALAVRIETVRRSGDVAAALALANGAIAVAPQASALYLLRGACRLSLGDADGAVADLRETLRRDARTPDAPYLLGRALIAQGSAAEAERLLVAQLADDPSSTRLLAAVGAARAELGDWSGALAPLTAAAADPTTGAEPCALLADALLRTSGSADDALRWLNEGERRDPRYPQLARLRAAAYMAKGDVAAAIRSAGG